MSDTRNHELGVLTTHVEHIRESCDRIETRLDNHSHRIRALESWRWCLAGGLAVTTFLLSLLVKLWWG